MLRREERFSYSSWRGLNWKYKREEKNPLQTWEYRYRYNGMGERESKRGGLNLNPSAGDRKGDTTLVRFDLIRVSTDPPIFHGLMDIAGDTTGITLSKDTITFSDTALADLGENIIISGDATLTTSNSDTTIVNFSGEIFKDSVFFNGFVSIGGDTTGVVFSKDTITFSDTVIIAVDSTVPPDNPVNPVLTTVSGGATLVAINSKSSPTSTPSPDRSWTYYLLGGTKEQLSVWQGTQTSQSGFCGDTGGQSQVYFYPTKYLTYGGSSVNITTHPNGTQEYRITDHLGSNRVTLDNTGSVVTTTDYAPFGGAIAGVPPRKGFIDKEKDKESGLGDFGVRKYDDEIGRFTSPDPLWEEYRAWSPYQYSLNNPILLIDPDGRDAIVTIKGNTITVSSKIYIYGSGASASTASIMQSNIMGACGADPTTNKGWQYTDASPGKTYDVVFDVQVELYNPKDPSDEPGFFSGKNNSFMR